jgi:hypothetical protein
LEAKYVGENVGVTGDRVVVGVPGSAMEGLDDGATKDTEEGLLDGSKISRGSALGPKEGLCEATTLGSMDGGKEASSGGVPEGVSAGEELGTTLGAELTRPSTGAPVGDTVKSPPGTIVGKRDSFMLGRTEGAWLCGVGLSVGVLEGDSVVSTMEGGELGSGLASTLGGALGELLGISVLTTLGIEDGLTIGTGLSGEAVGSVVGKEDVGDAVGKGAGGTGALVGKPLGMLISSSGNIPSKYAPHASTWAWTSTLSSSSTSFRAASVSVPAPGSLSVAVAFSQ